MSKNPTRNRARRSSAEAAPHGPLWLWGAHAVAAARANPRRTTHRLVATDNAARRLNLGEAEILTAKELDRLTPPGAVHQGVAVRTDPLEAIALEDLLAGAATRVAVLDQLADPHNLGAVFRSAAAFGFDAIILQTRHSPPLTGVVAKAAAGAIETVAECRVVNIARTLEALADAGWRTVGLDGAGEASIADAVAGDDKTAIVLGAEGQGLRPAVAAACGVLARIQIAPVMESLNVSNAAAIAFYETARGSF
ncbi:MAG: RNA methyltransferase [Pseudomonadota bacterium]